ncbi:MAG TPA: hypothetical protein VMF13_23155 [Luteitalea sp.]|nr:hypothetical protein [Luteitalea sp.]
MASSVDSRARLTSEPEGVTKILVEAARSDRSGPLVLPIGEGMEM